MNNNEIKKALQDWGDKVKKYQRPNIKKAFGQMLTSFLPFLGLWVLMYFSLEWSYWITLGLAALNAFFLVRIFIIQHDCGHQSFFKSRKWNNAVGFVCSFFSFIPYKYWAKSHNFHHAHSGQLEYRGIGDISTLTVKEFRELSKFGRFKYRLYRNPFSLFLIGPLYYMFVSQRLPIAGMQMGWKKVQWSQFFSNIYLILVFSLLIITLGWKKFFLVHVPIIVLFGIIAIWFFYVQHQHKETYKQWKENWEYLLAAIKGSSYYKLPKVFQWLSGNIGFHHIHHLSSFIPNYNLEKCNKENPIFEKYVTVLTFRESLKCMFNKLWDEEKERMISFREFYRLEKKRAFAS